MYHMVSPQCMHCLGHEIKTEAWVSIPGIPFTFFTKNNLTLGNRKWFRRIQHTHPIVPCVTRHGTVHLEGLQHIHRFNLANAPSTGC